MALYDVTNKDSWVNPRDASNYDVLQKARTEVGASRFRKDCDILDTALDALVEAGTNSDKLIFTKAGFLVGHKSAVPHVDVNHIWETAELTFPTHLLTGRAKDHANEMQLKLIGGLVRWRMSLRNETWLVYRRDSGTFNKYTGKEITISEYWVNNDYVFEYVVARKKATINDLKARFNHV